ncbi:hypothetical protein LTR17_018341 [Elasticomyces elasticus]|nr:hypothetical protein LTR17_018341 [Elasticomyces elasticus]
MLSLVMPFVILKFSIVTVSTIVIAAADQLNGRAVTVRAGAASEDDVSAGLDSGAVVLVLARDRRDPDVGAVSDNRAVDVMATAAVTSAGVTRAAVNDQAHGTADAIDYTVMFLMLRLLIDEEPRRLCG